MNTRALSITGLVVALVLLFAVNILSNTVFTAARIDLTENRLFTLSQGTRNILGALEEPITIRLYLSERLARNLPAVNSYATRIKGLLGEYERASNGMIEVRIIDPEPFSEEEDRAVGFGLSGVPLEGGNETLYMGLVGTNSVDDEDIIPFLSTSRESFIEYDITRMVYNLSSPELPVIGLLSSLPINGLGPHAALRGMTLPPWVVMDQVEKLFEVQTIEADAAEIPPEVDVLLLVHPKGLADTTLYAIDQFVLGGGRVLVFIDPHSESDQAPQQSMAMLPQTRSSELGRLFAAWGLESEPGKVVGDLQLAARVRMQRDQKIVTLEYPIWINTVPDFFDNDDTITAELGNITFASAGYLQPLENATTTFRPLIRTSENAALFEANRLLDPSADPQELLRDYAPVGHAMALAARIEGPVKSAFPDGPPPVEATGAGSKDAGEADAGKTPRQHLAESKQDINIIAVADTDVLADRFWVQVQEFLGSRIAIPSAANGAFLVNALDNLVGSNDLISVRNRGSFIRPFQRVNAIRQDAELEFRQKEEELIKRLEQTEQRLLELEKAKQGGENLILSPEQQKELVRFRQEKLVIRKDLRDVRRNLRRDIENLDARLKFINIALVPILIGVGGLAAGLWRIHRRKPRASAPAH
ncbi:MAG: ABC transporter [Gammaproteobacteria bacterium]|nr:ABC transporter [Gammaproteobacteria bacterium]NIN37813.1 ABC transporter [Gammaproteobacteria bacterium]NIO23473.1 ABC transporter [Gammaproteobacteria bacterium]NIO64089.1 ABC transporter [Gammaproteobacteria bacterium]NIP47048.1 ABC transporter [Gammaproteobacteria bacterium]